MTFFKSTNIRSQETMRNLLVYYLLLMGLIFYCGSPTFAADWFCDFEQSEGYLPGVINGQNGWWASSSVPSVIADGSAPSFCARFS